VDNLTAVSVSNSHSQSDVTSAVYQSVLMKVTWSTKVCTGTRMTVVSHVSDVNGLILFCVNQCSYCHLNGLYIPDRPTRLYHSLVTFPIVYLTFSCLVYMVYLVS